MWNVYLNNVKKKPKAHNNPKRSERYTSTILKYTHKNCLWNSTMGGKYERNRE